MMDRRHSDILDSRVIDRGFDQDDSQDMWLRSIAEHGYITPDPVVWQSHDDFSTRASRIRHRRRRESPEPAECSKRLQDVPGHDWAEKNRQAFELWCAAHEDALNMQASNAVWRDLTDTGEQWHDRTKRRPPPR